MLKVDAMESRKGEWTFHGVGGCLSFLPQESLSLMQAVKGEEEFGRLLAVV